MICQNESIFNKYATKRKKNLVDCKIMLNFALEIVSK